LTRTARLHRGTVDLGPRWQRRHHVAHRQPAQSLHAAGDQLAEGGGGRLSVAEGGVHGLDLKFQRLHQPGQAWGLAGG
jgi:hypothetical protein